MAVDPVAAAIYFVNELGCTAFPVWGSRNGRCNCGDPHDNTGKHGPDNVGKHPATMAGFKDGTADTAAIARFLANPGTPNYGLNAPPGVLVIDVDGADGLAKWEALQHEHGPLPVTLTTTTANGRHYFYRWPESAGPMPKGKLFGFVVRRHDDGYVIGPGSIHPKGVVYDTLRQPSGHPYSIAELPGGWCAAMLASLRPATASPGTITIDAGGYQLPEPGYDGARYDEIVRFTASRYIRGLTKEEIWAGVENVLAPRFAIPLSDPELRSRFERAWLNTPTRLGPPMQPQQDPESGEVRMVVASDDLGILPPTLDDAFPEPPDPVAFDGVLGQCVAALADATDASLVGLLASLITVCGAMVPATAHARGDQTTSPFVALVGESSVGRKGTAMNRALGAARLVFPADEVNRILMDGLNSGEALVTALDEQVIDWKKNHGSMTEIPPGSIVGFVFEEEFVNMLSSRGRDGSTLDGKLRVAFDGGNLSNRKAMDSRVVRAGYVLPALAAITPRELRQRLEKDAVHTGAANRWLYVPVVKRDLIPPDEPPLLPLELNSALKAARRYSPRHLTISPAVARTVSEYAEHVTTSSSGIARDLVRRYGTIATRIAMVHAAVEQAPVVGMQHLERALALTEYARRGISWVFGQTIGSRDADLLLRHLKQSGSLRKNAITRHIIRDSLRQQDAIDELVRLGYAEVVVANPTTGGRTTELRATGLGLAFVPFVQGFGHPQGANHDSFGRLDERSGFVLDSRVSDWTDGGQTRDERWTDGTPARTNEEGSDD